MTEEPSRRSFLRWTIYGLGAILTAVLGAPAVAFLIDARNRKSQGGQFHTVARRSELQVNQPHTVVIRETRRDAWTLHSDEVVGRVFLIKKPAGEVAAFTTICPHLGCSINYTGNAEVPFACPCHGARYRLDGERIDPATNPAPRGMDSLEVRADPLDPDLIQVKYQVFWPMRAKKEPRV
jgi:menaquinol-cytochrome c reductase iron-sulfur subunit